MPQSVSAPNQHVDRLHHHRGRVKQAREAIDLAARETVATHYADRTGTGPHVDQSPPVTGFGTETPAPAQ